MTASKISLLELESRGRDSLTCHISHLGLRVLLDSMAFLAVASLIVSILHSPYLLVLSILCL